MAERELSILVRAKGALQAARDIGGVNKSVTSLGQTASRVGKGAAILTGAAVGAAAIVVGRSVRSGLESLAALEDAETSVQGAINQAGIAGQVSAKQVSGWANEIETSIQAAFDDKEITQAATTLIRFGKVTPANLKPALTVMADLATKTGSVDSAATLLAKALADPEKAAGKLSKAGIVLTKGQQAQIKAFMKAGDAASAQKVILDELAKTTKGAAAASAGPYRDSLNILKDVTEDAQRALATGFLPVITKVRDLLSTELAKPATLTNIKKFGEFLAGGLSSLIDTARGLPWDSIGAALQLAGTGAKAVLTAFAAMPPWVQTAVLTGWGLNKLSGGAVTGIIGALGSGLIKGVLGMNAGVVNINAGVVNGAGGIPGAAGGGGGGGIIGAAKTGIQFVLPIAVGVLIANAIREAAGITPEQAAKQNSLGQFGPRSANNAAAAQNVKDKAAIEQLQKVAAEQVHTTERQEALLTPLQAQQAATKAAVTAADAHEQSAINRAVTAANATTTAARNAGTAAAAAIRAKDLSVRTYLSVSTTVKTVVSYKDMVKASVSYGQFQKSASGAPHAS